MLRANEKALFVSEPLSTVFMAAGQLARLPEVSPLPPVAPLNWYDFSDFSTLTLSGQRVSTVVDKGSSPQNLTQTVAAVTLARVMPSNRFAAIFNGTGYMSSSATVSDISSSFFFVGCLTTLSTFQTVFGSSADDGLSLRVDQTTGAETVTFTDTADVGTQGNASAVAGTPFVGGFSLAAASVTIYNNTVSETDAHAQALTAGRTLSLGANPATPGIRPWIGWIGELLAFDSSLSAGDSAAVVGYLMSKWKIT